MAFNQARMKAIAHRHITSSGEDVVFKQSINGEYDPSTGSVTSVDTEYTFKATKFNYPIKNSGEGSVAGSLIEANDRLLIVLPRPDVIPSVANWKVKIDGDWWTIVNVKHETYASMPIYLEIQCRLV